MKIKTFSLCMIFLVLLVCTTVPASESTDIPVHQSSISTYEIHELTSNISSSSSIKTVKESSQQTSVKITTNKKSDTNQVTTSNNVAKKTTSSKASTTQSSTKASSKAKASTTKNNSLQEVSLNTTQPSIKEAETIKQLSATKNMSSLKQLTSLKQAQNKYNLEGKVTCVYNKSSDSYVGDEEDALGVGGAVITVTNKSKVIAKVTSDSNGNYVIKNLAPGLYTVKFKYGTYAVGEEDIRIINTTERFNYVFIPDLAIITYSGSTNDGQRNKFDALRKLSDRFYFLESYNLNSSYDVSHQWMLDYANFILVDMYSKGQGFGVDIDAIKNSPASQHNRVAYTFGIFDQMLLQELGWGFLGVNPVESIENTYVGSYWQAEAIKDATVVNTNMKNLYHYILYLLGESDYNPTRTDSGTPVLAGPQWGVYYPGYKMSVPTPSNKLINKWIQQAPGYNNDGAGSLNWMTEYYNPWILENQKPVNVFRKFENWYNKHVNIKGSFVVIISYYQTTTEVEALIKEFERQGRAAFCLYQYATTHPTMTELLETAVTDRKGFSRGIVAGSSLYSWSTSYTQMGTNATINAYKNMNITILNALSGISEYSYHSQYGPQNEWTYKVTISQFEGIIGALPISYISNTTKSTVMIDSGVKKHVELVNGWAKLKETQNSKKKIAIVLYDYPPGKANIGASYLDVFTSTHDLLEQLADAGYDIGMKKSEIPTTEELTTMIFNIGNKGNWASGYLKSYVKDNYDELVKNHQLISKSEFQLMFNQLPTNLQQQLVNSWGKGLGNGSMIYNNSYLVIPGLYFGNVFITVQPARGWESVTDYHSPDLAPPQQYVAFYKYLTSYYLGKENNSVDAMISMGTHGTLEWLPGRTLGLQESDWPFQLIKTPIIYPYIVSNPGEGMTAKERSFAQVITHMTPVTTASTLYGEYSKLSEAISDYTANKKLGDASNMAYYKELILNLTSVNSSFSAPTFTKMSQYIDEYNYAVSVNDTALINEKRAAILSLSASLNKSMENYFNHTSAKNMTFDEYVKRMYEYVNSDEAFDAWLETIHAVIEGLSSDTITYGVHKIGYVWNSTEMIDGISVIGASRTNIMQNIMNLYFNINGSYYEKVQDRDFKPYQTAIEATLNNIVTSLVLDTTLENVEKIAKEKNQDKNSSFYQDLYDIMNLINSVRDNHEWEAIMTALGGGYVAPGLSGEPAASDVLPTGRSMYNSDTTKMPSKAAWSSAVNSINQILVKYMKDLGEDTYPELVAEVIWGTEVLRTEGISLAQYLYLLGVKPTWDRTGKVNGTEVIPLDELTITIDGTVYQRPRIDVFATIVSNNPYWLSLLTSAVDQVNALNESFEDNYVKKHYAKFPSTFRLFGLNGNKLEGTGVSDRINNIGNLTQSSKSVQEEIASVYESRLNNAWTVDANGNIVVKTNQTELFVWLLSNVNLIIQDLDSTWRYLDSDDYTDWFGGLLNSANIHGATPSTMLLDIRNRNNIVSNTLSQEVSKEIRTTLINPKWLQGMTSSVGGWNQMAANWENLHKTIFTTQGYLEDENGKAILQTNKGNNTGAVSNELYTQAVKNLVTSEYLVVDADYKSYAMQSMIGWSLTLLKDGYWKTTDKKLIYDLVKTYTRIVVKYGVACCHHTCGNIEFNKWIIKTGTAMGIDMAGYANEMNAATEQGLTTGQGSGSGDGTGSGSSGGTSSDGGDGGTAIGSDSFKDGADTGSVGGIGSYTGTGSSQSTTGNANGELAGVASNDNGANSGNGTNNNNNGNNTGNQDTNGTNTGSNSTSNNNGNADGNSNSTGSGDSTGNADSGNADGASTGNSTQKNSGSSDVGTSSTGASSAGSAAASSSSAAVAATATATAYEVSEKSGGKAASNKSAVSFGYLVAIVLIALLFFVGFKRKDIRGD
ncbi:cobaltochelatase subunit CobN [Methanosphaera sp.]|uniref:cobaltochelatase subunit CobN n=1 Tax=Methanosphaera sp. TaxID=2666342 RepID=UPI0026E10E40|nr:cobaltochelatase subunit CobN [Methanosphaera sp.]MDO5822341.1 cobaltochelatase subunit CobN [Methanosphaera sp.]